MKTNLLKGMTRGALCMAVCLSGLVGFSCDDKDDPSPKPENLKLEKQSVEIALEEVVIVKITSGNGTYEAVSDDTAVATAEIVEAGVSIKGISAGEAEVEVTDKLTNEKATVKVTVTREIVQLTLSTDEVLVEAAQTEQVEILSGSGDYTLSFDEEGIASAEVKNNFIEFKGLAAGEATLTVTDNETDRKAYVIVTVTPFPSMSLTSRMTWGYLRLMIDADPEDRDGVWIDLNGDGVRQENEEVHFGEMYQYDFEEGEHTITIYGRVKEFEDSAIFFTSFDCSNNVYLERMLFSSNSSLYSVDFTKNVNLEYLRAANLSSITELDVSQNHKLEYLDISNTGIVNLDVSNNYELKELLVITAATKTINFGSISKITRLNMWNSYLESLDLSNFADLNYINVAANFLPSLDVTNNPKLTYLGLSNNPEISSLDLSKCVDLEGLAIDQCNFSNVDFLNQLPNPQKLTKLNISNNDISSVNIAPFTNLMELSICKNNIHGQAMSDVVNNLPQRAADSGAFLNVIDLSPMLQMLGFTENNVATVSQVNVALGKNWLVRNTNYGGSPGSYFGSEE